MTSLHTHQFTWDMEKHQHIRIATENSVPQSTALFEGIKDSAQQESMRVEEITIGDSDSHVEDYKRIIDLLKTDQHTLIMVNALNPAIIEESSWIVSALYQVLFSNNKNLHIVLLAVRGTGIYLPPLLFSMTHAVLVGKFSEKSFSCESKGKSLMLSDMEILRKDDDAIMWTGNKVEKFSLNV